MDFLAEIEEVFDKFSGMQLSEFYTKKIDDLLIEIFNSIESRKPLCLIAVGGYGRAELAPFSDIDIMFFAKDKADSKKVEAVLYKLWDTGLAIGHSFRTADECIEEARKDLKTHTSLLEARFISGDKGLYDYFLEKVYSDIAFRKQKSFIGNKLKEMDKRHKEYGSSVFLLEPNVKEGQGCLRDIHTILWLSKVALKVNNINDIARLISPHDFKRLLKAYDFLLKIRFCLHLMSKRKNEILSFSAHDYVAEKMGFHNSKKFLGSERFMRYFYLKASIVREMTSVIAGICSRQWLAHPEIGVFGKRKITESFYVYKNVIISSSRDIFEKKPEKIIEAFYVFSWTGRDFSHALRDDIRRNLLLINRRVRKSKSAVSFFLDMLKGKRVYETLREMNETGVLGRFIPEFGALRSLVIYEPYHRYTVDEHTLLAIKHLELLDATKYKNLEHLSEIMKGIKYREMLFLSILFHDIGKAAGRHHGEEGYKRLKNIVERFDIGREKRQIIEFLVKNHVLMSVVALKREIENPETIAQFADAVGDEESLRAIYLMTYADMRAVNPYFWTEWKAYLLKDLYGKTLSYLRGVRDNIDVYMSEILSSYSGKDKDGLNDFLAQMPERYLLSTPAEGLYENYKLACKAKEDGLAVSVNNKNSGTTEITICAWDSPGLFSKIVGFLSSKWLNILSARLYTGKNGLVIDKIQISNWKELWWEGMEAAVNKGLRDVVLNNAPVRMEYIKKEVSFKFDVFIELDNESSEEYSIIEFFCPDRHGLLSDISNLFHENGLNIISARISTDSDIAGDIFYVLREGKKINDAKTTELLSRLWEKLKN